MVNSDPQLQVAFIKTEPGFYGSTVRGITTNGGCVSPTFPHNEMDPFLTLSNKVLAINFLNPLQLEALFWKMGGGKSLSYALTLKC